MKAKMFVHLEGLPEDVKSFFSLPIPKAVWNAIKSSQDKDFVTFIESNTIQKLSKVQTGGRARCLLPLYPSKIL